MQVELGAVLAGKARRSGKEQHQAPIDDLAMRRAQRRSAPPGEQQARRRQQPRTISRDPGPETRITATPDGGLPLDSAKIVSGNCICAGLPIALTSGPITGRDPSSATTTSKSACRKRPAPISASTRTIPFTGVPGRAATLAEARELDRPILLSVGYAACHWCHVMAHECFEDAEVAELMNRLYVNIKVDREERPDIDQIYMAALSATGEQGGWPLTMFLTPDAKPFWGGTYFPKQPRYGRPGFMQVLESIDRAWRDKRGELAASAETLKTHVESTLSARAPVADRDCARKLAGPRRRHSFHDRPIAWRAARRTQISQRTIHADALAELARNRRKTVIATPSLLSLRHDAERRHLRPHRRRPLPLFDRCRMAGAAFREDALRQRHAHPLGELGLRRNRRATVSRPNRNDDRLVAARNARRRRRLCRQPRCRQRRRGGLLLHVGRPPRSKLSLANDAPAFFSAYTLAAPHGWEGKPIVRSERGCARRICRDSAAAGQALRRARKTRASRPRRQGAGRLERLGDRGDCRGLAAPGPLRLA